MFNISLRAQEQCFTQLMMVYKMTPSDKHTYPILLCTLIVLKEVNPDLYRSFVRGVKKYGDVLSYLRSTPGGDEFLNHNRGIELEAHLVSCSCNDAEKVNLLNEYDLTSRDRTLTEPMRKRSKNILVIFRYEKTRFSNYLCGDIDYLAKKIDISERFLKK